MSHLTCTGKGGWLLISYSQAWHKGGGTLCDMPGQQGINGLHSMWLAVWCARMLAKDTTTIFMKASEYMLTCNIRVIA